MTLIRCDSNCLYQKDGYCTNDIEVYEEGVIQNISLAEGCIYYRKDKKEELIFRR